MTTWKKVKFEEDFPTQIVTPADGQLLCYKAADSAWENFDPNVTILQCGKTLKSAPISCAASGDNTIVALVASKRIKVYAVVLVANAAVNAKWKSGSTDKTGAMTFGGQGHGYSLCVHPPEYLNSHSTAAGEALILNLSAAVQVSGSVDYWDSDAT